MSRIIFSGGTGQQILPQGEDVGTNLASATQTLTNKTIDADNNTLSNIEVDNLKAGVLDTDISSVAGTDTTLASAKAIKTYVDSTVTATNEVVEDTSPQLGGALDVNGQKITSVSNGNIDIEPHGTGNVLLGNLTFNADQTVGASQDNFVLTFDNTTGLINLEASSVTVGTEIDGGTY